MRPDANDTAAKLEHHIMEIGGIWYRYWKNNPEKEDYMFNGSVSITEDLSLVYDMLAKTRKITKLKDLPDADKQSIRDQIRQIDPKCSTEKGMLMAKSICALIYFSKNDL